MQLSWELEEMYKVPKTMPSSQWVLVIIMSMTVEMTRKEEKEEEDEGEEETRMQEP